VKNGSFSSTPKSLDSGSRQIKELYAQAKEFIDRSVNDFGVIEKLLAATA